MAASAESQRPEPPVEKMPGHWLLAKMGKRVLRPGGLELTERLLSDLAVTENDDVVEFAPGLGITARMMLARKPKSYIAVEREPAAVATLAKYLVGSSQRCILGTAEITSLPDATASVVYGEAMLSMQPASAKAKIIGEAARLLRPGGRYGIHELCLVPDDIDESIRSAIQHEMTDDIHVGVRALTGNEWCELLAAAGLTVTAKHNAPMHLLEPVRLMHDEGLLRAMRFIWNVARNPAARRRVHAMRRTFRKYSQHVAAIALVCIKT
jgi:quercetin dioxygenase-like cupin family protein/SAM-dependent methyltransferase